jgi:hypothetical protein
VSDSGRDGGMCCDYGEGSIAVYATVDGVDELSSSDSFSMGTESSSCRTRILGAHQTKITSNSRPVSTLPRSSNSNSMTTIGQQRLQWLSMNMDRSTTWHGCRCRLYLSKDVRLLQHFSLSTLDWALLSWACRNETNFIISIVFMCLHYS